MILPELMKGQEARDYLHKIIFMFLSLLCNKIDSIENGNKDMKKYLAISPDEPSNTKEILMELLDKISRFLDLN